jgi:hypothetical protein
VNRRQRGVERLDAGRIDRAHFFDDAEEVVELREHRVLLACAQLESSQMGDLADVLQGQWHVRNGLCLGRISQVLEYYPALNSTLMSRVSRTSNVHKATGSSALATQRFAEAFAPLGPLLELKVAPSR